MRLAMFATDGTAIARRRRGWNLRVCLVEREMRICIFGAGAIGSHFGARLAASGNDVSVLARLPGEQTQVSGKIPVSLP
jgi:phosphoglycerate dehydrogenase-like enzyme